MAKATAQAASGFAMAIDIICCILSLFIIGFFGYTTATTVEFYNGFVTFYWDSPWYVDMGVAMGVIDFFLTLTTSILGCVSLGGQAANKGVHMGKVGLDTLAWILMLIAAACATATAPGSLSDYTGECNDGWDNACAFGVGVALAWAVFGLLFIASILHIVSLMHAKSAPQPAPVPVPVVVPVAAPVAAPATGDIEAAK